MARTGHYYTMLQNVFFLWQHQVLPQNVIFPPLGLSIQSYKIASAPKVKKLVYVKTNTLQMSDVLLNDNYEYDNEEDVQLSHSDETVKLTL